MPYRLLAGVLALALPALSYAQPLAPRQAISLNAPDLPYYFPSGLAAADFDGDGRADLAASSTSGHLSVLRNADGFAPTLVYRGTTSVDDVRPRSLEDVVAADVNEDGRPDLVAPSGTTNQLVVSLNAAPATGLAFRAPVVYTGGPERVYTGVGGVAVADFDGDGHVDLAATRDVGPGVSGGFFVLPGRGDGTFGAAVEVGLGGVLSTYEYVKGLTAADLNGDGRPDVALVGSGGTQSGDRGRVVVLLNQGGAFAFAAAEYPVEHRAHRVRTGDVNEDGRLDLVTTTRYGIAVLLGTGTGRFAAPVRTPLPNYDYGYMWDVRLGDLDLDGHLDAVVTHGADAADAPTVSFLKGDGAGAFEVLRSESGVVNGTAKFYNAFGLVVADLGTDGRPDVALVTVGYHQVNLYENVSAGAPPPAPLAQGQWSDAFADALNGAVRAIAVDGDEVFVGGRFTEAGGAPASHVAVYDKRTGAWAALGGGVAAGALANGDDPATVSNLVVTPEAVFVEGAFETAGGQAARGLARWDRRARTWAPFVRAFSGSSSTFPVNALALAGDDLYVAGTFTELTALDGTKVPAARVARYSLADGTWHALGAGIEAAPDAEAYTHVRALVADETHLYAGGLFERAGGTVVRGLARWNFAAGAWADVGGGVLLTGESRTFPGTVSALARSGPWLYVAGEGFQTVGGGVVAYGMARYHVGTGGWEPLGDPETFRERDGFAEGQSIGPDVLAVALDGRVFAGGPFAGVGSDSAAGIAVFNPATGRWSALGSGLRYGTRADDPDVLVLDGSDLYVGGLFETAGGVAAANIARYRVPGLDLSRAEAAAIADGQPVAFRSSGVETAVTLTFAAPNGQGAVAVTRVEAPAASVTFTGPAPRHVSPYRFVIEAEGGFAFASAEIRFRLADLMTAGITDPASVTVYRRPTPGQGAFQPLPTRYDAATDELVATTTAFSEFVFGSDSDGNPLPAEADEAAGRLALRLAGPNPFRSATALRLVLPAAGRARLDLFDALGRRVATLADGPLPAGPATLAAGDGLAAGTYFARLTTAAGTRTVVLTKTR